MPRIAIEEGVWSDPRFQRLLISSGDRHRAVGLLVNLWRLAQKFWLPGRLPIPKQDWADAELGQELIACGFAEEREDGFYARGAESHFQWWFDGIEQRRMAGQRSAEARRARFGSAQPSRTVPNESRTAVRTKSNDAEPSSSPLRKKKSVDPSDTTRLWDYYSKKLECRQIRAVRQGAKTNALCKSLVDQHGFEDACRLVDAFLSDGDAFVRDQAWQLGLLVSQQQKYLARAQAKPRAPLSFGGEDP